MLSMQSQLLLLSTRFAKANPYRDMLGRFTFATDAASGGGKVSLKMQPGEELGTRLKSGEWKQIGHTWGFSKAEHDGTLLYGVPLTAQPFRPSSSNVDEPPLPKIGQRQHLDAGVIIKEPDGRVWMVREFGKGGELALPKGHVGDKGHEGESAQQAALRETYEETGLNVKLTRYVGDYRQRGAFVRFYEAERTGGAPWDRSATDEVNSVALSAYDKSLRGVLQSGQKQALKDAGFHKLNSYEVLFDVGLQKFNEYHDERGRFATSGAKSGITHKVYSNKEERKAFMKHYGLGKTADLLKLCGVDALGKSKVDVEIWDNMLMVTARSKKGEVELSINPRSKDIELDWVKVKKEYRGEGIGTKLIGKIVKAASKLGFKTLSLTAAKDVKMNGYYTWARLGFDSKLRAAGLDNVKEDAEDKFSKTINSISDIMKQKGGADWWLKNGDEFDGTFDLRDGSTSRKVFESYVKVKGK